MEKGGEPAGTWGRQRVGNGAADLGFGDGDTVRREDFEPLYGQFLDPRDPTGQTHLGSAPAGQRRAGRDLPCETGRPPGRDHG